MKRFVSLASAMMAGAVMARNHHHPQGDKNNETKEWMPGQKENHHPDIVPHEVDSRDESPWQIQSLDDPSSVSPANDKYDSPAESSIATSKGTEDDDSVETTKSPDNIKRLGRGRVGYCRKRWREKAFNFAT
jgi:hypothetical protein